MSSLKQDRAVILIVESDPALMTSMAATLQLQAYDCHPAATVEDAMQSAENLQLDLIICDMQVEHESGLELCRRIHELRDEQTPLIFVSAAQQPDIIWRSHASGAAYHLRKPFAPELLLELVDKALWLPHLVQSNIAAQTAGQGETLRRHGSDTPSPMGRSINGNRSPQARV